VERLFQIYLLITPMPPFLVLTLMSGLARPDVLGNLAGQRALHRDGKVDLHPPLRVLASRRTEYCSGTRSFTPPLVVSTSSPAPTQVVPSR